ncbi:heavy metal-binding domain-containing protein, partial [Flavobacterium sp.]|uniref:heavy metal-binding domain-containing protein n=1 Tax=Flavobacterium sp. TaxID=239 RepID=UPI00286E2447
MIHTYNITGMTCDGCLSKVEKTLNAIEGIEASVSLQPPIATITMKEHIPIEKLQQALSAAGKYTITISTPSDKPFEAKDKPTEKSCCSPKVNDNADKPAEKSCCSTKVHDNKDTMSAPDNAQGKYYCPMHCEGEKVYDKPGDCPVCGMDLIKGVELTVSKTLYTCPMHPEV